MLPAFEVVSTVLDGTTVRVTSGSARADAPLTKIEGSDRSGAVIFVATQGFPTCDERGYSIEVLDASGAPLGCIGSR